MGLILLMDLNVVMCLHLKKISTLSIIIFELSFYQFGEEWKHKSISVEISKIQSDKNVD